MIAVPPTSIAIDKRDSQLVVGTRVDIICHSFGSRPPAHITWYIDNIRLGEKGCWYIMALLAKLWYWINWKIELWWKFITEGSHETSSVDGNVTESILQFTPRMKHIGKVLRCKASNPLVEKKDIFSDWPLNISCKSIRLFKCTWARKSAMSLNF